MRWSNLSIEEEQRAQLPGYQEEAVVRHFEAPDAIPTRFYEVRARSILNRVPEASRMPFGGRSTRTVDAATPAPTADRVKRRS